MLESTDHQIKLLQQKSGRGMVKVIAGNRVGKEARLGVGCSEFVLDKATQRVLLARRSDDGNWCVPGGYMEPGESFSSAAHARCARKQALLWK